MYSTICTRFVNGILVKTIFEMLIARIYLQINLAFGLWHHPMKLDTLLKKEKLCLILIVEITVRIISSIALSTNIFLS